MHYYRIFLRRGLSIYFEYKPSFYHNHYFEYTRDDKLDMDRPLDIQKYKSIDHYYKLHLIHKEMDRRDHYWE